MLDSIYHMTMKLIQNHIFRVENVKILQSLRQQYNGGHYVTQENLQNPRGLWILLHLLPL